MNKKLFELSKKISLLILRLSKIYQKELDLNNPDNIKHLIQIMQLWLPKNSIGMFQFLLHATQMNQPIAINLHKIIKARHVSSSNLQKLVEFLLELIKNQGFITLPKSVQQKYMVGKNLATTPNKIIFQNNIMTLRTYVPTQALIFKTPILIVPSCINKYYILDLSKHNSLIRWLNQQGFLVYVICWDPLQRPQEKKDFSFNDYIFKGILKAIDLVTINQQHQQLHIAGYCLGGTLLNCAIAYLQHFKDQRIISITNLMTIVNFENAKNLNLWGHKAIFYWIQNIIKYKGYLDGRLLNHLFYWLQPEKNIWPKIFKIWPEKNNKNLDLLYWNHDYTNIPKKMYNFYLKHILLQNKLKIPQALKLKKVPIDLSKITLPVFWVAGEQDQITNWQIIYQGSKLYHSKSKFVLTTAGHIKGIINPPKQAKYAFKTQKASDSLPADPLHWLKHSTTYQGSWWNDWIHWLTKINSNIIVK